METALRDGLRGRAPAGGTDVTWAEDTAATRMLTGTGATSALPRTSETAPHRRLEPLDEPPPRRPPARRASAPPPSRKRGGHLRLFVRDAGRAHARRGRDRRLPAVQDSGNKSVQLRENVRGNVDRSVRSSAG